ncbi:MAG: prolyl oligopeptidase family serine peptidase [Planctomycetota bacterium]
MRRTAILMVLCAFSQCVGALEKSAPVPWASVLPEAGVEAPAAMMNRCLLRQVELAHVRWLAEYEQRKTAGEVAAYQARLRAKFLEALGGLPERTPLEAQVAGALERDGYRVEKIVFQSQPRHFVTAALFLPEPQRHKPPWPGVLVPCGHSDNGKALDNYQRVCALAALNGLAALIFDPPDQGERAQLLDAAGKPRLAGVPGHNMIGAGSMLLGRNTARYEVWDGMRALDYLASRPDVDPQRLGCTGNSGGGTQTAYLMALDERIGVAAPSCYLCSLSGRLLKSNGAQDAEQNIFGQLAFGMDHADYMMMRAPKPTLLCTATRDFFNIEDTWASFRLAQRLYARLGAGERMCLVETDAEHGFSIRLREAAVRWMLRWLCRRDEEIAEPAGLKVPSDAEIQCTPRGQVMLLDGARSVYDLNRDCAAALAVQRKELWAKTPRAQLLSRVRALAGVRAMGDLPKLEVRKAAALQRQGCRVEKLVLAPEEGIVLPALWLQPEPGPAKGAVLLAHQDGKQAAAGEGGLIEQLVSTGHAVLAVDLRGSGETQQAPQKYFNPALHGPDGQDFYIAYLLGRTYVGMRTEDLLAAARWVTEQPGWDKTAGLQLLAVGQACIPALHAAALEPLLFHTVKLVRPLVSWSNVVELGYQSTPYTSLVHGALTAYDLPDLRSALADKLTVEEPLDALGRPAAAREP